MREKVGNVAKHCVFPMICGSGGSKSRLAKAAGAEPAGQMRDEKLHAVVARSTFPSQNAQNTPGADHFWYWDVKKSARRCGAKHISSQNVQKHTSARTTFGSLRCQKSARRCVAKHISKSKCTKHTRSGPLLKVAMSKKCTPLCRESTFPSQNVQNTICSRHSWRFGCWKSARRCGCEAHCEVKMYKTHHCRTTFGSWDVEKVHAVVARSTFPSQMYKHQVRTTFGSSDVEKVHAVVAQSTFGSQNVQNTPGAGRLLKLRCRKSARRFGVKMYKTLGGSDHFWRFRCRFASRHYTTGQYTTLHSSTLHYTTLHSSTLHYVKLLYTTLHYTEWHCNTERQVDS